MSPKNHKTSYILQEIAGQPDAQDMVTMRQFMAMLGDRAFFLGILVFSLPNSLPVPGIPGFSTITGLPILFLAAQVALGHSVIWMPKRIAEKSFSRKGMNRILSKATPAVVKLERLLKPRLLPVTEKYGERFWALLILLLTCILVMPIPGGNFLPGLSISLIALGMLERDGLFLLIVGFFIVATLGVMVEIITVGFHWMSSMLHWVVGIF